MPSSKKQEKPEKAEQVKVQGLRTLGDVESTGKPAPKPPKADPKLAKKALDTLKAEFDKALALKEKLAAEAAIGSKEKGRASLRQSEKLRSLVASLEGMNRFALAMGLISPAESRELYADAMKRGLYEGWR